MLGIQIDKGRQSGKLGALLGGLLADAYSLDTVLLAGAALTLAAFPVAVLSERNDPS